MGTENFILGEGDFGVLYIDGKELGQTCIQPFECDIHEVCEEHRDEIFKVESIDEATLTFKVKFDNELFYKLTGLYDWIYQNCPNRKVVHLMKHAKKKRVRDKNFKRALRIVGRLLDK